MPRAASIQPKRALFSEEVEAIEELLDETLTTWRSRYDVR